MKSSTVDAAADSPWATTFDGPVTWQLVDNSASAVPGQVLYEPSSALLRIVRTGTRSFPSSGVQCDDLGVVDIALGRDRPQGLDVKAYVALTPDGRYVGSVYGFVPMEITQRCTNGHGGSRRYDVWIEMSLEGTVTGGRRMQGEMVERRLSRTTTSTWDFDPR